MKELVELHIENNSVSDGNHIHVIRDEYFDTGDELVAVKNFMEHMQTFEQNGVTYRVPGITFEIYYSNSLSTYVDMFCGLNVLTYCKHRWEEFTVSEYTVKSDIIKHNSVHNALRGTTKISHPFAAQDDIPPRLLMDMVSHTEYDRVVTTLPYPSVISSDCSISYRSNYDGEYTHTEIDHTDDDVVHVVFGGAPLLDGDMVAIDVISEVYHTRNIFGQNDWVVDFDVLSMKFTDEYIKKFTSSGGSVLRGPDGDVYMLVKNRVGYVPYCLYYGINPIVDEYVKCAFRLLCTVTGDEYPNFGEWDTTGPVDGTNEHLMSLVGDLVDSMMPGLYHASDLINSAAMKRSIQKRRLDVYRSIVEELQSNLDITAVTEQIDELLRHQNVQNIWTSHNRYIYFALKDITPRVVNDEDRPYHVILGDLIIRIDTRDGGVRVYGQRTDKMGHILDRANTLCLPPVINQSLITALMEHRVDVVFHIIISCLENIDATKTVTDDYKKMERV